MASRLCFGLSLLFLLWLPTVLLQEEPAEAVGQDHEVPFTSKAVNEILYSKRVH